ncbi:TPA: hypothetical protein ACSLAA_002914, partial [Listeria innocua]
SILEFVEKCNFKMYKNAFSTYFHLTETPRSVAKSLSKNINKLPPISYKQLIQQIQNLRKKDLLNLIRHF